MLKQVEITKENMDLAMEIEKILFPEYSAEVNYRESVEKITTNRYYLLYIGDNCVGISGIYAYDVDPHSAWLGWFGILPQYRRNGYGSMALRLYENEARELGYTYARLYTDRDGNDVAIAFYENNGYSAEEYRNANDMIIQKYPILIFSKNLTGGEVEKWSDRYIDLTSQVEKQLGR